MAWDNYERLLRLERIAIALESAVDRNGLELIYLRQKVVDLWRETEVEGDAGGGGPVTWYVNVIVFGCGGSVLQGADVTVDLPGGGTATGTTGADGRASIVVPGAGSYDTTITRPNFDDQSQAIDAVTSPVGGGGIISLVNSAGTTCVSCCADAIPNVLHANVGGGAFVFDMTYGQAASPTTWSFEGSAHVECDYDLVPHHYSGDGPIFWTFHPCVGFSAAWPVYTGVGFGGAACNFRDDATGSYPWPSPIPSASVDSASAIVFDAQSCYPAMWSLPAWHLDPSDTCLFAFGTAACIQTSVLKVPIVVTG
jgi:hypothetical protein